ncbi:MAG: hypothetical protein GY696_11145, partial [Gammaproteobacteria bacterium]|nr:hypothetical protein [Gammaproteobacteria bacterium]
HSRYKRWSENYCHADSNSGPWCYTMDPAVRWQYCFPTCSGTVIELFNTNWFSLTYSIYV